MASIQSGLVWGMKLIFFFVVAVIALISTSIGIK